MEIWNGSEWEERSGHRIANGDVINTSRPGQPREVKRVIDPPSPKGGIFLTEDCADPETAE